MACGEPDSSIRPGVWGILSHLMAHLRVLAEDALAMVGYSEGNRRRDGELMNVRRKRR